MDIPQELEPLPPEAVEESLPGPPPPSLPRIKLGELEVNETSPLLFEGRALFPHPDGSAAPCGRDNCERHLFDVEFPGGYWEENAGALEVSIAWEGSEEADFEIRILDAEGKLIHEAPWGQYARVALLENPASGAYVVEVRSTRVGGAYEGVVQVEPRKTLAGEPRDLLPNLVALPPRDLSLVHTNYYSYGFEDALGAAGVRGCGVDEFAEKQAQRCLRFATSLGNAGDGPLELRLTLPERAKVFAGEGQMLQRIYRPDGTFRDEPAGKALYHATHQHIHYYGFAAFQLFAYDWEAEARGSPVGTGAKTSFCTADEGLVRLGLLGTSVNLYDGAGCDPLASEQFMGLSPHWFDRYELDRPDQYVEVTGLPDGVYELVQTADADGTLLESDEADNEAGIVFRMQGEQVEVLRSWSSGAPFRK